MSQNKIASTNQNYGLRRLLLTAAILWVAPTTVLADSIVYTQENFTQCHDPVAGAGIGAATGGFLAAVFGGRAGEVVAGAAAGGVIGAAMSCHDKTVYIQSVDHQLDLWSPTNMTSYERDGVRVSIIQSGFAANGALCRTYQTEYLVKPPFAYGPPYWDSEQKTACYDGIRGIWVHGYTDAIFALSRPHNFYPPVPWVHVDLALLGQRRGLFRDDFRLHHDLYFAEANRWTQAGPARHAEALHGSHNGGPRFVDNAEHGDHRDHHDGGGEDHHRGGHGHDEISQ